MPACQVQSAADQKRVLGTRIHTPGATGGPRTSRVPAHPPQQRADQPSTATHLGLNHFQALFQPWKGQSSSRKEALSSLLEEAAVDGKREPGVQSPRSQFTAVCCASASAKFSFFLRRTQFQHRLSSMQ